MHLMSEDRFVEYVRQQIFSEDYLRRLKPLALERMSRFEQFVDNNSFFFNGALNYDQVDLVPKDKKPVELRKMLKDLAERLDEQYDWRAAELEALLKKHKDDLAWKPRDYFMTVRLVLTGRKDSPPLNETMEVLGREIVRFRIRDALLHPKVQG